MYCNRYCLCVFVCVCLCVFVCVWWFVTTLTRNCVYRFSPNWVCRWRYHLHLQLIKFWPSCANRKGVCSGAKNFGSALLQPARSACVSPSAFFIHSVFQPNATNPSVYGTILRCKKTKQKRRYCTISCWEEALCVYNAGHATRLKKSCFSVSGDSFFKVHTHFASSSSSSSSSSAS